MERARKIERVLWMAGAVCSVLLMLAANWVGVFLGTRFGAVIDRVGKGKIADASGFIGQAVWETGMLFLLGSVLLWLVLRIGKRMAGHRRWIVQSITGFAALNLWIWGAMHTIVFWGGLYTGSATSNFTQFEFKKELLRHNRAAHQILLLGSSQTQAQVDENVLNQKLRPKIWTTELHFPGSKCIDLLLVLRKLRRSPADEVICYVSEYYFYSGLYATTPPYFGGVRNLALLKGIGLGAEMLKRPYVMGMIGDALPLFRCRESLKDRILGIALSEIGQVTYNTHLEADLEKRAEEAARTFNLDQDAEFQKRAFEEFLKEAERQGRKVMILEGQVNPILGRKIAPEIRSDMKKFLEVLSRSNANLTLIREADLPLQTAADYKDLTHVTEEGQKRFSNWLADYIVSRGILQADAK